MFLRNGWKLLLILVFALALALCLQVLGKPAPVNATSDPENMHALLETWEKQALKEGRSVTFQLHTPLTKGGDTWIEVPFSDSTLDFDREWGDIGDDYVCFDERGG